MVLPSFCHILSCCVLLLIAVPDSSAPVSLRQGSVQTEARVLPSRVRQGQWVTWRCKGPLVAWPETPSLLPPQFIAASLPASKNVLLFLRKSTPWAPGLPQRDFRAALEGRARRNPGLNVRPPWAKAGWRAGLGLAGCGYRAVETAFGEARGPGFCSCKIHSVPSLNSLHLALSQRPWVPTRCVWGPTQSLHHVSSSTNRGRHSICLHDPDPVPRCTPSIPATGSDLGIAPEKGEGPLPRGQGGELCFCFS